MTGHRDHYTADCPDPEPWHYQHKWPPGIKGMDAPGAVDLTIRPGASPEEAARRQAEIDTWLAGHVTPVNVNELDDETREALAHLDEINERLRVGGQAEDPGQA